MGKLNQAGIDLIKEFEGCVQESYPDPGTGGHPWTIGFGHTGSYVRPNLVWTRNRCEEVLLDDCEKIAKFMNEKLHVPQSINDNQFSAMLSFAFNAGPHTLANIINNVGYEGFADKIQEYVFSGLPGQKRRLPGSIRRRAKEAELYRTPIYLAQRVQ